MNTLADQDDMTQQHVDALTLASWGFEVGPLTGKAPLTARGFKDFTTAYGQIGRWWGRWPAANIGMRPPAFAVVLDVDVRHGGMDTWAEINAGHTLPTTLVTETGTGGLHVWFRLPYRADLKGSAGQGIDVKHRGGYLVAPGSSHPDTGRLYRCISWCLPDRLPELPQHLRRHVFKPARPARPAIALNLGKDNDGAGIIRALADAQPGGRNDMLNWAAYTAAKEGLNLDQELTDTALAIGLGEAEIRATLASAHHGAKEVA